MRSTVATHIASPLRHSAAKMMADVEVDTMPVPDAFLADRKTYITDKAEYETMYKRSVEDPSGFWGDIANNFYWEKPFDSVVEANFAADEGKIFSKWFSGGKTNICYNALDRHVKDGFGDQIAMHHEANDEGEDLPSWTYAQMLGEVERLGSYLRSQGIKKGDRVSIFMPMVPQLPIAMLACARIGAVHSVVFGGFSAEALAGRLIDAQSSVVLTADGVMRGTKPVKLYDIVAAAGQICGDACMPIERCVVLNRLGDAMPIELDDTRDVWWDEALASAEPTCEVEWMDSEDPLFVLYTSGSTGKPKGVLHTTGGYMVYAATTSKYIFDLKPDDTFFCTADCGWITGHSCARHPLAVNPAASTSPHRREDRPEPGALPSPPNLVAAPVNVYPHRLESLTPCHACAPYWRPDTSHAFRADVTYGPMLNRATQLVFEGVPSYPDAGRMWRAVDKYSVSQLYTAPTAIRALMRVGDEPVCTP